MSPGPIAGAVLTGGASRRMGTDKAFLEVAGTAMVVRVVRALAAAGCDPVWCQGGDAARLRALGLAAEPDPHPGAGPVPAIAAAIATARRYGASGLVVAACDLPDLTADAVAALLDAAGGARPAALAVDGAAELVSWWPAAAEIPDGVHSFRGLLERLGAALVPARASDVRNVNTPADLERPGESGPGRALGGSPGRRYR